MHPKVAPKVNYIAKEVQKEALPQGAMQGRGQGQTRPHSSYVVVRGAEGGVSRKLRQANRHPKSKKVRKKFAQGIQRQDEVRQRNVLLTRPQKQPRSTAGGVRWREAAVASGC